MSTGDLNVALILKLVDQVTGPARAVTKTLQKIGTTTEQTGRAGVAWANEQLAANQARRGALMGEAFGVAALAGSLAASLRPAIDFERSMAEVAAVARADDEELARLTETARELGATTPWAASEAAQGMRFLSMAGFEVNETIDAMPGMLNLASAGAIDLGRASDIASDILSAFKMEASEMGRLGDVLTNTFTSSNTDLTMLGETMKYVAPVAEGLGISLEDTAAMAGLLANSGIKGSQAGTTLRAMMSRIAAPTKEAQNAFQALGIQTLDAEGNLRDFPTILREIHEGLGQFGSGEQQDLIAAIAGLEAATGAKVLIDQAGSGALQAYAKTLAEAGSAARVAAKLNDNTAGALKHLQSMTESAAISIGTVLLPEVRELIETVIPAVAAFQSWAEAHPELISTIFKLTAGLLIFRLGSIALRWVLFSMLTPILQIIRAGSWLLVLLPRLGRALLALLNPMKLVRGALIALRFAFLASGIGALLVGVAMAGVWIYNNWSGLEAFFVGFWQAFREALGPALPMLDSIINYGRQIWQWFVDLLGPMDASQEQWLSWGASAGEALGQVIGNVTRWIGENKGLIGTIAKVYAWFFALRLIWLLPMAPIRTAGRVLAWIAKGPVMWLLRGVGLLSRAFIRLGVLMLTNPIGLIIAGIAALAYVVYANWDKIVSYLTEKINKVKAAFDEGLLNGVLKLLSEFNPFLLVQDAAEGLFTYITGWTFDDVWAGLMGVEPFRKALESANAFFLRVTGWDLSHIWDAIKGINPFTGPLQSVQKMVDLLSNISWEGVKGAGSWAWNKATGWVGSGDEPGRDRGGPVRAGVPYLVGERSPEIFVPGVSGTILPARVLKAAMAASAMAGPVAAMPSQAEIVETLDRRPVMSAPAPAPQITRQGDTISINIYPSAGMSVEDIGREVERRLARREDARRADLHDGVDY